MMECQAAQSSRGGRGIGLLVVLALAASLIGVAAAAPASAKTVWLCKPGLKPDPCKESRTATSVTYEGSTRTEKLQKQTSSGRTSGRLLLRLSDGQ